MSEPIAGSSPLPSFLSETSEPPSSLPDQESDPDTAHAELSRFLPKNYDRRAPIAVMAGKGTYPALLVEAVRRVGVPVRLIGFEDETENELIEGFQKENRAILKVGQLGKMLRALGRLNVRYAIMAGQITPKKLFKGLHPDLRALTILASLKEKNAETIFGAIAREITNIGVQVLDARVFLDDQLAHKGAMSKGSQQATWHDLEHGIRIAKEVARLDIGQGVVVRQGTVLAVEAFEGTDAMLRRAGKFGTRNAIFVKTVKPKQDYRIDVPVLGGRTLEVLEEAGIIMVAVEADKTLILEKEKVLREATRKGISITGYEA